MPEFAEQVIEQATGLRRVAFTEVGGGYELWGDRYLMQAVGELCGVDIFLHAKHGEWTFETEDEHGHPFPPADGRAFRREGRYRLDEPGTMEIEWATRLLHRCLSEFRDQMDEARK